MPERLIIRQKSNFETEFYAADPGEEDSSHLHPISGIHQLTPYGMLLAGLGSCTGLVLHTYALNHGLALELVELRLVYDRHFMEDCQNCERIDQYREEITEEIIFTGKLSEQERQKLYQISKQCPIHKMLEAGLPVKSQVVEDPV